VLQWRVNVDAASGDDAVSPTLVINAEAGVGAGRRDWHRRL